MQNSKKKSGCIIRAGRWWAVVWRAVIALQLMFPPPLFAQESREPIVVASKNLPESALLGEIMAQLIEEHTDIPVVRKPSLGATAIVIEAMKNKNVDLYPEYTGTGWAEILKMRDPVRDKLQVYLVVDARMRKAPYKVRWLQPFGFENSFALAMPKETADKLQIRTISDLRNHQSKLRVGVSTHFATREDGWAGLAKVYGLKKENFKNFTPMEHAYTYEALKANSVDLIQVDMTDGKLARLNMVLLQDDRNFFLPYDAVPVIRQDTLERYPELEEVLSKLAFKLDRDTMQELNRRVAEGESVAVVAQSFLRSIGQSQQTSAADDTWTNRASDVLVYLYEHLFLVITALVLAILAAVPMGILLTRWAWASPIVLGVAGIIQTIPSLALLMFMIPIFGIDVGSAIAALFLYALLPIVRNTYTGIIEVDKELIEAARGLGMKDLQILWKVELPLATRTIMAGIRTSTVIGIGVATLAAFLGAGGLGTPIVLGLQRNDLSLIFLGAVPAALLALLADYLLGWVERLVRPKGVGD